MDDKQSLVNEVRALAKRLKGNEATYEQLFKLTRAQGATAGKHRLMLSGPIASAFEELEIAAAIAYSREGRLATNFDLTMKCIEFNLATENLKPEFFRSICTKSTCTAN